MKKTPNVKLIGAASILLIAMGLALCGYQYSNLTQVSERAAALQKEVDDQSGLAKAAEETGAKVKLATERLAHLELSVSQAAYIPTMLTELERTGRLAGMEVLGVRPKPAPTMSPKDAKEKKEKRKPYLELDIEIKGRGPFRSVLNFLAALQEFPRIVEVKNLSLAPKTQTGAAMGKPDIDMVLLVRTFIFPPASPVDPTTAKANKGTKTDG